MSKKYLSEKTKKKIKEKRFFIVLACCVAAIGAISFTNSIPKPENAPAENKSSDVKYSLPEPIAESEENSDSAEIAKHVMPEETYVQPENPLPAPDEAIESEEETVEDNTLNNSDENEEDFETVNFSNDPPLRKISAPTDGKILASYNNSPAYSEITGDWRTHEAIDYAVKEGSEIAAADSGKILKIITSDLYGATIIIDHENTMKTLYANVLASDGLKEGDVVTKGDIIGTAEHTSLCEKYDDCHIHFEVMINDKNINPNEWLE